jgi:hypothetical protein
MTYYYLYPEDDYFIFDVYSPTLKFSANIETSVFDIVDIQYTSPIDPSLYFVSRKSKKFMLKSKNLSAQQKIIVKTRINNL